MAGDVILETQDLVKELKGFVAVAGADLQVRRCEIHALIGPDGAGKTACFDLLTRLLAPTCGRIPFQGRDIIGETPAQIARSGFIRSFRISATLPHLTLLENVRIALQRRLGSSFHSWSRSPPPTWPTGATCCTSCPASGARLRRIDTPPQGNDT